MTFNLNPLLTIAQSLKNVNNALLSKLDTEKTPLYFSRFPQNFGPG